MAESILIGIPKKKVLKENDKTIWVDTGMTAEELFEMATRLILAPANKAVMFDPSAEEGEE